MVESVPVMNRKMLSACPESRSNFQGSLSTMCPIHSNLHGLRKCTYCMQMQENPIDLQQTLKTEAIEADITQVCIVFMISN